MPNADKCHLNIPFKEYLKQLKVDEEGKVDGGQAMLDRIADQEFENYKAIERRVNDPACAGAGCCADAMQASYFSTHAVGFTQAFPLPSASGDFFTVDGNPPLALGIWQVSFNAEIVLDASSTGPYRVTFSISGGGFPNSGWQFASSTRGFVNFSGTIYAAGSWSPTINVNNGTTQSSTLFGNFSAVRFCDPCEPITIVECE